MTYAEFELFFRAFDEKELWKFRLAFHGGKEFVNQYCVKFSGRESDDDYSNRLKLTYNPAFASGAINEVKNSVFKRVGDIAREGGPKNYQRAVKGLNGGVDLLGSTMNEFICVKALTELLIAGEFGVYVDKPPLSGSTLADNTESPYVYLYKREDILAYEYDDGPNCNEFKTLLVRDYENKYDQALGLSSLILERFKLFKIVEVEGQKRVQVQFIDKPEYVATGPALADVEEMIFSPKILLDPGITKIPFVFQQIPKSFMTDIADAQIALMNLVSGDIWYLLKANFPFYIEPWDPKSEAGYIKKSDNTKDPDTNRSIKVGPTSGRRYPVGQNQPAFISPSTDPIKASMEKQEQIKKEIREMVQLSLGTLVGASADSKTADKEKLEDGLAYLSILLQKTENLIAEYWAMYEGVKPATVQYPMYCELEDPKDIREWIKLMLDLASKVTSQPFKREILKNVAKKVIAEKVNFATITKILKEIDDNDVVLADWQEIAKDIENGLVDNETASIARGYPQGSVDKAKVDHTDRLLRIQNAQTPAPLTQGLSTDPGNRGMKDQNIDPQSGRLEKQQSRDTTQDPNPTDKTRGPGQIKD